jgi:S1-C subfamily serine protease
MVIIVGRAYGNLPTVSFGAMNERHPWNVTKGTELVSMSAPVYPGNNGGAVLNFSGELIGVVSGTLGGFESDEAGSVMKVPPEIPDIATPSQDAQMSFAITVETLKAALPRMRSGGEAKSAYFGVRVASAQERTAEQGVVISDVVPRSPAQVAGLRGGDVIFRYDGTGVTSAEQLIDLVRRSESGSTVQVVYMRDGNLNTAQVVLTEISPYQLKLIEQKMPQRQAGR